MQNDEVSEESSESVGEDDVDSNAAAQVKPAMDTERESKSGMGTSNDQFENILGIALKSLGILRQLNVEAKC